MEAEKNIEMLLLLNINLLNQIKLLQRAFITICTTPFGCIQTLTHRHFYMVFL